MTHHKKDAWLLGILLGLALLALIPFFVLTSLSSGPLCASIYRTGELLQRIDLSKESEERSFIILGTHGEVEVTVKHNAIKVSHSDCPGQDCVDMGYRDKPGVPIVCAYNGISIVLEGGDKYSVTIG